MMKNQFTDSEKEVQNEAEIGARELAREILPLLQRSPFLIPRLSPVRRSGRATAVPRARFVYQARHAPPALFSIKGGTSGTAAQ